MTVQLNSELSNKVITKYKELKNSSPTLSYFLNRLELSGQVCLFGGAPRDWWLDFTPKDVDIVVELRAGSLKEELALIPNLKISPNNFGNSKFTIDGITFDMWELKNTVNFGSTEMSFDNLPKIVPYNLQAIIVMTNGDVVTEPSFWQGVEQKRIDFVAKNNIQIPLFLARKALNFHKKYQFELSEDVMKFCLQHLDPKNTDYVNVQEAFNTLKEKKNKKFNDNNSICSTEPYDSERVSSNKRNNFPNLGFTSFPVTSFPTAPKKPFPLIPNP